MVLTTEYYLDIETYSPGEKPDPLSDRIISIAYQKLSTKDGYPEGRVQVLTEWGFGSEKTMLSAFKPIFITDNDFDFIPIGVNLYGFDLVAILRRLNHYFRLNLGMGFFRSRPVIDIKPILVIMNRGSFQGFERILSRKRNGSKVKQWYDMKDYDKIIDYEKREARNFIRDYQTLKKKISRIRLAL